MTPSLKRFFSLTLSAALVAGAIPHSAVHAVAANRGVQAPAAPAAGARSLPQSALVPGQASAARTPVKIEVSPETTKGMTSEQKADLSALTGLLEQRLFTNELAVSLPETIFDNARGPIVGADDLFNAPQATDLDELARKYPRLTPEMRRELYKTGAFSVASTAFPGQTHVFKTADWIQQGADVSKETLRSRLAAGAKHLVSDLPRTINGGTALSLDKTLSNVAEGLHETAGLLYGMRETRPAHSEAAIEAVRLEDLSRAMAAALPGRDLFLYDAEGMRKAAPALEKAQKNADESWAAKKDAVAEELGKTIEDPQQLADALAKAQQQELYAALTDNTELEAVHAGLGALLVQRLKFKQALRGILDEGTREVRAYGETVRAKLAAANPILSRVPGWTEKRVSAAMAAYAAEKKGAYEQRVMKAGEELGLSAELSAESAFQKSFLPKRAALLAETRANRAFSWLRSIWSRKNWTSTKNEDGGYTGSRHTETVRTTKDFAWRLSNLAQRYLTLSNETLYGLLNDWRFSWLVGGLANGPLGWRALLSSQPFAYRFSFDSKTGQWSENPNYLRQTYVSRLKGLYAQRRALWAEFEATPESKYFLGKGFSRLLNYVKYDLGLGVIAPLIVGAAQPVLTLVNTTLSLSLALAAPLVIAPALAAGVWAFQALVFDYAGSMYGRWRGSLKGSLGLIGLAALIGAAWYFGPRFGIDFFSGWWAAGLLAVAVAFGPLFPWVGTLVKKAGFYGAAASVVSVAKALLHAVAGPAVAAASGALWALRRAWDNFMKLIIVTKGRVPSGNSRFLRRVAGPGIGSEYFFQVKADVPLVAAWAAMESSELARYEADVKGLLEEPAQAYARFAEVIDALTLGNNQGRGGSPAYKAIADSAQANGKTLAEALAPRQELYGKLLKVPNQNQVKLAKDDLELLLKKTAVLAERFYGKVMKDQAWPAEKQAAFWKQKGLSANDWVGLAKQLQAGIFGGAILTPFEDSDKTLRISVDAPGLADYVKGLEQGMMPGQLDSVQVGDLGRPQSKPDVKPAVPVVRVDEASGGLL